MANAPLATQVAFAPLALSAMIRMSESSPHIECGGILMGTLVGDGTLVISFAAGPGTEAQRSVASFQYDHEAQKGFLSAVSTSYPAGMVGIWHCHPGGNHYSSQDLATFTDFVTDHSWNMAAGVFPILGRDWSGRVDDIAVYYLDESCAKPVRLPWRRVDCSETELLEFAYGEGSYRCDAPFRGRKRGSSAIPR